MAYGHAERNLSLIRQLEAETMQLLEGLDELDPEQSAWLHEVTVPGTLGSRQRRPPATSQRSSSLPSAPHVVPAAPAVPAIAQFSVDPVLSGGVGSAVLLAIVAGPGFGGATGG
jgi:hypothetical protein